MLKLTSHEAQTRLDELIQAVFDGETVVIETVDHAVQLVPSPPAKLPRKFGSAAGMIHMSDDFDAPLDDFAEYMS